MNTSSLERWAPLTGLAAMILLVIGSVVVGLYEFLPPAEDVATALAGNPNILLGGYLGVLGAFFLLWFGGCLRSALYSEHVGHERLAATAFGGAVASAVIIGIATTILIVAGERAAASVGISPDQAATMYDIYSSIMGTTLAITLGAMIGATGMAAIRKVGFPMWFGWVSVVLALAMISPLTYVFVGFGALWIAVASVWLFVKGR